MQSIDSTATICVTTPCAPSHIVFSLISPLSLPLSLLVNNTLKPVEMEIFQTCSASKYASHKPLASVSLSLCLSVCLSYTHAFFHFCLLLYLRCGSHFSRLTFISMPYSFAFICHPFFNPGIYILLHPQPQCPPLVSTFLC